MTDRRSLPKVLPDRIRNARKQDASRIDDAETPDGRYISRDDVLRVDAGVQEPFRQLSTQARDECRALIGLLKADLHGE